MPEVYSALFADYMATVVGAFYRTASLTHTEFVCKIPDRQLKRLVGGGSASDTRFGWHQAGLNPAPPAACTC